MTESREDKAAAARVRMTELAAKFIERTHGELATMREHLAKLAAGDASMLGEIHQLAHRMAGTGATLGLVPLSECAAHIEYLAEIPAPGAVPNAAALAQLGASLDALEKQLRSEAS
jgi:chemotaxis protein histidine kinase CheA